MNVIQKLGYDSTDTPYVDRLEELTPVYACAKCVQDCTININKKGVSFKSGIEYVIPVATFLETYEDGKIFVPSNISFKERYKGYRGEDLTGKSLLIWRYGGIGDLLFIQPIVKYLKAKYDCRIGFATSPNNLDILRSWPPGLLSVISPQPFSTRLMDDFDYHLTFEGGLERCKEGAELNAYDVFRKIAYLDYNIADYLPELVVDQELRRILGPYVDNNVVAVQLRASSPLRSYPLDRAPEFSNAFLRYGFVPGLIDHRQYAGGIQDYMVTAGVPPSRFENLALLSATLFHYIALLDLCAGTVAVDSSGVHIAAALKKPVLGIYGAFPGLLRMRYYPTGAWIDKSNWNDCGHKPCMVHHMSKNVCDDISKGEFPGCMNAISVDEIAEAFSATFSSLSTPRSS